jgi:hypothetical protein
MLPDVFLFQSQCFRCVKNGHGSFKQSETNTRSRSCSMCSSRSKRKGASVPVYKNRYGKYAFAVPLLDEFICRQQTTLK